jgi:Uma2 family endonuclease
VARIVLNRPEARNAQDTRMLYELNEAFDAAARDDEVKVIVLAANGPHFSAGHDLREQNTHQKMLEYPTVGTWCGFTCAGAEAQMAREKEIYTWCSGYTPVPRPESRTPMYPSRDFPARAATGYRLVDEASRGLAGRKAMAVAVAGARRLFTRAEYHRMGEVGILKPTDRVELIRGEIVEMSPIGRRHVAFVNNLNQLLVMRLAGRAIVSVQNPVVLADDSEPQPDLAVLRKRAIAYKEAEATIEDLLLLIEVAESSLSYDRSTKLRLYAEAGVPEYWVVDVAAESVEVHRAPDAGGYRELARLTGASVSLLAFPDVSLTLAEVFA